MIPIKRHRDPRRVTRLVMGRAIQIANMRVFFVFEPYAVDAAIGPENQLGVALDELNIEWHAQRWSEAAAGEWLDKSDDLDRPLEARDGGGA